MRIGFLLAEPPGPPSEGPTDLARHARDLEAQLQRMGHECRVLAGPGSSLTGNGLAPAVDVLHVLHGLDGTRVAPALNPVPTLLQLHPSPAVDLPADGGASGHAQLVVSASAVLLGELYGPAGHGAARREVPMGLDYQGVARPSPNGSNGTPVTVMADLRYGTCSYAALEAAAAGTLILAPDRPGVRECFARYHCGLTYQAGDPASLDALLQWLASEPALVEEAVAGMRFPPGIEDEAFALEQAYRDLLRRPAPARTGTFGSPDRPAIPGPGSPGRLLASGIICPTTDELVARSSLLIAGWAVLDRGPVVKVDIAMGGVPVGPARLGMDRPEIAAQFPSPEAPVSGFELHLDLSDLPPEVRSASFEVTVHGPDGSRFVLDPVEVEVEPPLPARPEVIHRPAGNGGRPAGVSSPEPPGSRPEVRLVVFTHDLGYGGAQLYLWEMLRQLAGEAWFSATVVSPAPGPLSADLEAIGIGVHITSGYPVDGIPLYEGKQDELAAWVRAGEFNVVLANTLLAFPGVDVASRLGLPSVWAIHESYPLPVFWRISYPPSAPIHPYVAARAQHALASATALVFETASTRAMFETPGAANCLTVPYGVDVAALEGRAREFDAAQTRAGMGIPEAATVLLCLGTVQSRKAQTVIAQAFREVADAHPDAFLVFVGDLGDRYSQALHCYLDRAGLAGRSLVVPVVADPFEWYAVADLFVSASDVESLPRSVLEAMALGVPVAATSVFGLPELLDDGRTGYLCEPRNVAALAGMLDRFLNAIPAVRRSVGRAGARLVRERHDSSGYAQAYRQLFRQLVGTAPTRPAEFPARAGVASPAVTDDGSDR